MKSVITTLAAMVVLYPTIQPGKGTFLTGEQQEPENAVVKYLRADLSLRQAYALPPDAAKQLQTALESPLDAEDEKLVAAADEALIEFGHGAKSKRCDWEMSVEDGPLANTAHRGAIMELVSVSGLRARLRFRDGDPQGATRDVLAAIAATRHLSLDGSLASVLFAYKMEAALTGILAQNLYRLSPTQLQKLKGDIDALPSGSSLGAALVTEKVARNDLSDIARAAKSRDDLVEILLNKIPLLQSNRVLATEIVDKCGATVKGFLNCVNQQEAFYNIWAGRFNLPPEQFEREYKAEISELSRTNPVIRQFTPALPRFRWTDEFCQTRRALLQAAIAVRLDGPKVLEKHPDPYDGNPFAYVPLAGGFRLESRLNESGAFISLSIATTPTGGASQPR